MKAIAILNILKKFQWIKLGEIYGMGHSSIVGFIASEWIKLDNNHCVIDGAPSPIIGKGRKGQVNADLLLCKKEIILQNHSREIIVPIEVETDVSKYEKKLKSLQSYMNKCSETASFCILYMANCTKGNPTYGHNWENIKDKIKVVPTVLISTEKNRVATTNKKSLEYRSDYSNFEITSIDYWIKSGNEKALQGSFYKRGKYKHI